MFNNILLLFAGLLNIIGTIYAVLSILKLTLKDLHKANTWNSLLTHADELLIQKKQARTGISLIITGWVLQGVFTFYKVTSCHQFWISVIIMFIIVILVVLIAYCLNNSLDKKYRECKQKTEK